MSTKIAASEAKAKFSELLDRTRRGEGFAITLHGEEVAELRPAEQPSLGDIQRTIAEMRANRVRVNPPGMKKLKLKDLINEGRP